MIPLFQFQKPVIYLDSIGSTNDYLNELRHSSPIKNGTVVLTGFQTKGRGQQGNFWESNAMENLLFSFSVEPQMLQAEKQFLLSMVISLGICDYLKTIVSNTKIKWPNDIYVGKNKIAGILIENHFLGSRWANSVAGIGFNVNQKQYSKAVPNAVSMAMLKNEEFNLNFVLQSILNKMEFRINQLYRCEYEFIKADYLRNLYLLQHEAKYRVGTEVFFAKITDVGLDGQLLIETEEGRIKKFYFKEIEFIPE